MSNHEKLLQKYFETFGESFPMFMAPESPDDIKVIIEKCLKTRTPYDPYEDGDINPNADY